MENGRVVESGTHESLLALGGRYRALYDLQFGSDPGRGETVEANGG
jgi:ATP-binding cassette subfamily B protein